MSSPTESPPLGLRTRAERASRRAKIASYASIGLMIGAFLFVGYFVVQAGLIQALKPRPKTSPVVVERPRQISTASSQVAGFDDEHLPYEISAGEGFQDETQPNLVHLRKVDATLQRKSGKTYRILAEKGIYDTKTKEVSLEGDVRISDAGDLSLTMPKAHIKISGKELDTDMPVEVALRRGHISAGGMQIREDGKRILFLNGVKAHFENDGKGDKS